MSNPKLTLYGALDLLARQDARMVQTNINGDRTEYYISPACVRVEPKVAEQIKAHPQIIGGKDGMWPGHDQTWRMRSNKTDGGRNEQENRAMADDRRSLR